MLPRHCGGSAPQSAKFYTKKQPMGCRGGWVARSFFRAMVSVLTENNSCRSKINSRKSFLTQNVTKLFDRCAEWRPVLENSVIQFPQRQIFHLGSKSVRNSKFDTRAYIDVDGQILCEKSIRWAAGPDGSQVLSSDQWFPG